MSRQTAAPAVLAAANGGVLPLSKSAISSILYAVISESEGKKQEQINLATGAREAAIAKSEGEKQSEINVAEGKAQATIAIANATAQAISLIAKASEEQGGNTAINLKVAEQYIDAFSNLAKTNNTLIVPSNLSDVSGMVGSVMKIVQSTKTAK